jgi:hypothetical protein
MIEFKEILTKHADAFKDMTGIDATVGNVSAKLKELGYAVIIDDAKNPGYISKSQFDEVSGQRDQLKVQADDFTKQLNTLKTSAKGNEDLLKTIDDLQKQNGETTGKYQAAVIDSAIKLAAVGAKAKNPEDIMAFVDRNKIVLKDDGTVDGVADQIKGLSETKGYLFGEAPAGTGANPAGDDKTASEKAASDFSAGLSGN